MTEFEDKKDTELETRESTVINGLTWSYTVNDDNTATITGVNPAEGDIEIPSEIDGHNVTCIGNSSFYNYSGLTGVTIPDSVTSIGKNAFYKCTGLTSITIPGSVTSVGTYVFGNCSNLANVTIRDGATKIGSYMFHSCTKLTSITIPASVTNIGNNSFDNCNNLTEVYIHDLTAWCEIIFGDNPLSYAGHLYLDNEEITDLIIPDGVVRIGNNAFSGCGALTSVTIPDSVTSIGISAFSGCNSLSNITIPDSVTKIETSAFRNCTSLTNVIIPVNVTYLGNTVFSGCSNLKNVTILGNITNDWWDYLSRPFGNCPSISTVIFGNEMTKIGNYMFAGCNGLSSITINGGITSIGEFAFKWCNNLTSVIISDSVISIGKSAFSPCEKLSSVIIGNGVTSIGDSAFKGCNELVDITIGNSVTSIEDSAFANCENLTNIEIPNSVTNIGSFVFSSCINLENVILGNSVTSIGEFVFLNCGNLSTNIEIPDSVMNIGNNAFDNCNNLPSITFGRGISSVGLDAFYNCDSLNTIYYYRKFLEPTKAAEQRIYNLLENCGKNRDELEYICLNPEDDDELYKKNSNEFSFVDTAADLAVNRDFVKGYLNARSGKSDETTIVWETLSAIGNDISRVLYENILNYIQDVSDINTCAVKSVCSMSKMVGTDNYVVIDELSKLPREILNLLDIFSIKREYLLDKNVFNALTRNFFISEVNTELSTNNNWISKVNELSLSASAVSGTSISSSLSNLVIAENWEALVSSVFSSKLQAKLNIEYTPGDFVYNNLSSRLNQMTWEQFSPDFLDDPYRKEILDLKVNLKVSGSFNPFKEANDVYFYGKDFDSSSGGEKTLVDKVLECRARQKFDRLSGSGNYVAGESETKYSWYKEREFYDYLTFIHDQQISKYKNVNLFKYYLDSTYNELAMLSSNPDERIKLPELSTVNETAQLLTRIALAIADVREQIKTQAQKNHMRGTFVLISYLINQYLTKNIPIRYPALSGIAESVGPFKQDSFNKNADTKIQLQEYEDNTEYYNLMTKTTSNAGSQGTNARFWELEDDTEGIAFSEIDDFYLNTLNLKHSLSADTYTNEKNPRDFLDIIYSIGADMGHLDRENKQIVIPGLVADEDSALEVDKHPELSAEYYVISALQRNLYLSYTGNTVGFAPERNFKNKVHSSYQIHPYLWKFTEYDRLESSIVNAYYNSANEDMIKILVAGPISAHIGNYGNNINIWKDNFFDFTGYKSRYENGWHSSRNGLLEHYDGSWYPDTIEEFILRKRGTEQTYESPVTNTVILLPNLSDQLEQPDQPDQPPLLQDPLITPASPPFQSILYSVYNRKTTDDIIKDGISAYALSLELCGNEIIDSDSVRLSDLYKAMFAWDIDLKYYQAEYEKALSAYDYNDDATISTYNEAVANLAKVKDAKPETFFGKWYKTDISKNEARYIANQLYLYADRIESIYNNSENYNIYKYGLDKYGNSFILYKVYPENSNYVQIKNTGGELWIRKNAHPLAFPAFDNYEDGIYNVITFPQVRKDGINNSLLTHLSTLALSNCIYEFDTTNDYKYLTLATKRYIPIKDEENFCDNSIIFFTEPHENTSEYDLDNYEYKYSYTFRSYNEHDSKYDKISSINEKFAGFFNTNSDILTIFSAFETIENTKIYVTSIGPSAFYGCTGLTNLDNENIICDVTESIGEQAFYGCSELSSITIPNKLAFVGISAFGNCNKLKTIYYHNPKTAQETKDLLQNSGLTNGVTYINWDNLY